MPLDASDAPVTPIAVAAVAETPAVICVEASAAGADAHPIEIGFVLPDGQGFCTLVRPEPGWTSWDAAAERRHRITPAALARHGRGVDEVAALLNERLGGRTLHADGAAQAAARLDALFAAAAGRRAFRIDELRTLLSTREAALWNVVRQQVATELRLPRHRASGDARILQRTWQRLRAPLQGDRTG